MPARDNRGFWIEILSPYLVALIVVAAVKWMGLQLLLPRDAFLGLMGASVSFGAISFGLTGVIAALIPVVHREDFFVELKKEELGKNIIIVLLETLFWAALFILFSVIGFLKADSIHLGFWYVWLFVGSISFLKLGESLLILLLILRRMVTPDLK